MNYSLTIPNPRNIIMWALTYRCNMSCDFCYLNEKVSRCKELSVEEMIKLAKNIVANNQWRPDAIWLTGGEPTILPNLPDIVTLFEEANIKTVITTNGLCEKKTLTELVLSKPRGINVSYEINSSSCNTNWRDNRHFVSDSIKLISETKSKYTTLGVSCVLLPEIIDSLVDFAKDLKTMGVEYLSLNPFFGKEKQCYTIKDFEKLEAQLHQISDDIGLLLPSKFFFSLIKNYYTSIELERIKCPVGTSYFFISPWGEWFPCSDEKWQTKYESSQRGMTDIDYNCIKYHLQQKYNISSIYTDSNCFSERCIGCWKLYYDTIFTDEKNTP